ESNTQTLGSGKIEGGGGGGGGSVAAVPRVTEGEEIRVGRYTVQVGESRLVNGDDQRCTSGVDSATATGSVPTEQRARHHTQPAGAGAGGGMVGPVARRAKFKAPAALNTKQQQQQQPEQAGGPSQTRQRLGFRRPGLLLAPSATLSSGDKHQRPQQQQQQQQQQQEENHLVAVGDGGCDDKTE
ncbi:unnamed protein product, partial [Scytosiphon promiscuus]